MLQPCACAIGFYPGEPCTGEKLIVVPNISGFGTSQLIGHLDFFPNGGEEMPGCKKNALSQIVDLDGIWSGKARLGHRLPGVSSAFPIVDLNK